MSLDKAQITIRCPDCGGFYQPLPPFRDTKRICSFCGRELDVSELVGPGRDGIYAVKPDPPAEWNGRFLAVYPSGEQSDFDLAGRTLRPGDELKPGYVLDRWELTDKPVADGLFMPVGILRDSRS